MYRTLLVPVDGSPFSEAALPLARLLARRSGASLHIVHVHLSFTGLPVYVEGLPVIDAELHSQARIHEQAYLEGLRSRIAAEEPFPVQVALLDTTIDTAATGTVPGVLATHARQIGADLVIMS
nr:universal stress protein [Chloroflexaceae bacterium]